MLKRYTVKLVHASQIQGVVHFVLYLLQLPLKLQFLFRSDTHELQIIIFRPLTMEIRNLVPFTISCTRLHYFNLFSRNLENKAYPIHTDAGQQLVYCHFSNLGDCGPGPWTMVMKIDGFKVYI